MFYDVSGTTVEVLAIAAKSEAKSWLAQWEPGMKEVPLSENQGRSVRYLRETGRQEIVVTRHRKPAGVLIGFESEEEWFDYRTRT